MTKTPAVNSTLIASAISLLFFFILPYQVSGQINGPWLKYEWKGGFSPYEKVRITIENEGKTTVEYNKFKSSSYTCNTQLSPEEMADIRMIVKAVNFFAQPDKDTTRVTDTGTTVLFIEIANKSRELIFEYRPELYPLTGCLQRLLVQAEAIQSLGEEGQIYDVLNAVSPQSSGAKILQPYVLAEPLKLFIQKYNDVRGIENAIKSLSWITTPEAWTGFLVLTLENADKDRREFLMTTLTSHSCTGGLPKSHLQAMCPLLLAYLADSWPNRKTLSDQEHRIVTQAFYILGHTHYEAALPFLKSVFDDYDDAALSVGIHPIAYMGKEGLYLLSGYLDHKSENKRLLAAELIEIAFGLHPYSQKPDPVDNYNYSIMAKMFTGQLSLKLQTLAQKDPSEKVQKRAEKALNDAQKEIEVWKSGIEKAGIKL